MKISANLATSRHRLAQPLAVGLWLFSLSLSVVAVMLITETIEIRAEQPRYQTQLRQLDEQIRAVARHEPIPPTMELEAMRRRVAALNALSGTRGWDTSQLLTWFESQLPNNVYISSLHHKPREGEILLIAESLDAEALTAFLLKLENEEAFSEVLLSKQGVRSNPGSSALQFEVRIQQKQ